ncbi:MULTISPECIES: hypothetical protein [unclassified Pseudonocardia]|jgi:hypothetical protein|uniref:hypothetical protein n=1 Tax=unclassified Pseudonocardia TaxID=2619320 RepID=UPI0031017823
MTVPTHDRPGASPVPAQTRKAAPTRDDRRSAIVDRLLDSLEDLVVRHRALAGDDQQVELHAELIAAEVAHELSVTRSALKRNPPLRRTG